jgi:DNA-binding response OmpR family regulator
MPDRTRVLIVSDDRSLRERLRTGVFALGAQPVLTGDPDQAVQIAVDSQPEAAIIDGQLAQEDARVRPSSLRRVKSLEEAPFMLLASDTRAGGLVRLGDDTAITVEDRELDTGSLAARLRSWLRPRDGVRHGDRIG